MAKEERLAKPNAQDIQSKPDNIAGYAENCTDAIQPRLAMSRRPSQFHLFTLREIQAHPVDLK
ncbi:MAG: hypothetical protein ACYC3A_00700 [Halothiobacillus sp.]